jgi:hypothetical protein
MWRSSSSRRDSPRSGFDSFHQVLRIRNSSYESGSVILYHGSRSSGPINYGPDPDPIWTFLLPLKNLKKMCCNVGTMKDTVYFENVARIWIFLRIRVRGFTTQNSGSGSRRPIYYESNGSGTLPCAWVIWT